MDGNIEISSSNMYYFVNAYMNDMVMYTSDPSQHMLLGTQSNSVSALDIYADYVRVNRKLNHTCNACFGSVYEQDPKAAVHVIGDLFLDSNDKPWNEDHGPGLVARYSTFAGQDAAYIQASEKVSGNVRWHNLIMESSNVYLNTNGVNRMFITHDGFVGVGHSNPGVALHVNGHIYGTGDIVSFSDLRKKTNLEKITRALDKVGELNGYTFNKIGQVGDKRYCGLIAQEVEAVIPELVYTVNEEKSVAYGNSVALLVEAVKELTVRLKLLESRLDNVDA